MSAKLVAGGLLGTYFELLTTGFSVYVPPVIVGGVPNSWVLLMPAMQMFTSVVTVVPSDSAVNRFLALQVLIAGDLVVTPMLPSGVAAGADVSFTAVPAGTIIPFSTAKVKSSGTTATVAGLQ